MYTERKKRSEYEIIFDILKQFGETGIKRTQLMFRSRLNYKIMLKYLSRLAAGGFVEERDGMLRITDRGRKLLEILYAYMSKKNELIGISKEIRELYPEINLS